MQTESVAPATRITLADFLALTPDQVRALFDTQAAAALIAAAANDAEQQGEDRKEVA